MIDLGLYQIFVISLHCETQSKTVFFAKFKAKGQLIYKVIQII